MSADGSDALFASGSASSASQLQLTSTYPPYTLHPRVAYTSVPFHSSCVAFINERTVVVPIGRHCYKLDVSNAQSPSAAPFSSTSIHKEIGRANANNNNNGNGAGECQLFFTRSVNTRCSLAVNAGLTRLAIVDDPRTPNAKAGIAVFDLTSNPVALMWQQNHTHNGYVTSVSWSSRGENLCVCVDWGTSGGADSGDDTDSETATAAGADDMSERSSDATSRQQSSSTSVRSQSRRASKWSIFKSTAADARDKRSGATQRPTRAAISLWRAETKKLIASHEFDSAITTVSFNPDDANSLCASGNRFIRFLRSVGTVLDEIPIIKRVVERTYSFTAHRFINGTTLVGLTSQNELCVFDSSQLKQIITRSTSSASTTATNANSSTDRLISLASFKDGFIVGSTEGRIQHFALNVSPSKLTLNDLFISAGECQTLRGGLSGLVMSPANSTLIAVVTDFGLCSVALSPNETFADSNVTFREDLIPLSGVVAVAVSQMRDLLAVCTSDHALSIFNGATQTIRCQRPFVRHVFAECPLAVAMHANGYSAVVGFESHIALVHIMRGDIKQSHTFTLPTRTVAPLIIQYDHAAARIAVATGIHLFIYSAHNFALIQHFNGAPSLITCIQWNQSDQHISTASADGFIDCWDTNSGVRTSAHCDRSVEWTSLASDWGIDWCEATASMLARKAEDNARRKQSSKDDDATEMIKPTDTATELDLCDRATTIVIGNNGGMAVVKVIRSGAAPVDLFLKSSDDMAQSDLSSVTYRHAVIDRTRGLLWTTTSNGRLCAFTYPLSSDGKTLVAALIGRWQVHDGAIAHFAYFEQNATAVTVGIDGHIVVTDLRIADRPLDDNTNAAAMPVLSFLPRSDNVGTSEYRGDDDLVFVRESEFVSLLVESKEKDMNVRRVERTAEYQLNAQKEYYTLQLKTLRAELETRMSAKDDEMRRLRRAIQTAEEESENERIRTRTEKEALSETLVKQAERRLLDHITLYEAKCDELADERRARAGDNDRAESAIAQLKADLSDAIRSERDERVERIREFENRQTTITAEYETAISQLESEHDEQVAIVKRETKTALAKHRENTAVLVAEMSAAKKKLEEKQSNLSGLELVVSEQDDNLHHLSSVIRKLSHELAAQKTALRSKEEDITRRQYELAGARQDNTVLKNFIEILEHRIAELENREAPALDALLVMKGRMESMNHELFILGKEKMKAFDETKQKRGESERLFASVTSLRHKLAKSLMWADSLRKEIRFIVEHSGHGTDNARLHSDLAKLYSVYLDADDNSEDDRAEDSEDRRMQSRVAAEVERQRRYLEKSLSNMRTTNGELIRRRQFDSAKTLKQNILFLNEVNALRDDNQKAVAQCNSLSSKQQQANTPSNQTDNVEQQTALMSTSTTASSSAKADIAKSPRGRISGDVIVGSTRALSALSSYHSETTRLTSALSSAEMTMASQRDEIDSLKRTLERAVNFAQRMNVECAAAKRRVRLMNGTESSDGEEKSDAVVAVGDESVAVDATQLECVLSSTTVSAAQRKGPFKQHRQSSPKLPLISNKT